MERRPAAVTRLHTVVEADNHGSLTLLFQLGQMSSDLPNQGVPEVNRRAPPGEPGSHRGGDGRLAVGAGGAEAHQRDAAVLLAAFGLLFSTMTGCVEFVQRMAEDQPRAHPQMGRSRKRALRPLPH